MTTAGKWMFIIGLILSIIAAGAAIWGVSRTVDVAQRMESQSVRLTSPQTVAMEQGDSRMVLNDVGAGSTSCTVTLPDGTQTDLEAPDATQDQIMQDAQMEIVGVHTAQTAGEYEFSCEGGDAMLTPGISMNDLGGAVAAGLGLLALLPLGLLTLIGLILWLVGRGRDKKALQTPVGSSGSGYAYGPDQGYGGPPRDDLQQGRAPGYGPPQDGYGQTSGGYGQSQRYGQVPPPPPQGYGQPTGKGDPYATGSGDPYATGGQQPGQGDADRDWRDRDDRA